MEPTPHKGQTPPPEDSLEEQEEDNPRVPIKM